MQGGTGEDSGIYLVPTVCREHHPWRIQNQGLQIQVGSRRQSFQKCILLEKYLLSACHAASPALDVGQTINRDENPCAPGAAILKEDHTMEGIVMGQQEMEAWGES